MGFKKVSAYVLTALPSIPFTECIHPPEKLSLNAASLSTGFNNVMAGARIVCGSDRFDGSGLFGAMIPSDQVDEFLKDNPKAKKG